jgi:hypothetical protein
MRADLSAVDVDTIDRTVSACSWLCDIAEAGVAAGEADAAAALRWLELLGSRLHQVRLERKAAVPQLWPEWRGVRQ